MPTLLDLAGFPISGQFNGGKVRRMQVKSVLAMLEGKTAIPYAGASNVGYEIFGLKAYIVDDWKILWMPKPFGPGEWELFNIKQDPAEINNLSKQHPERLKDMIALWEQYKKENKVLDISLDLSVVK